MMPFGPTLVVVDMQPSFAAARDPDVIIGVTAEIIQAMGRKNAIVIVEYVGCGVTHPALIDLLRGYPHKSRITKIDDDGSIEVIRALRRRKFNEKHLRVCGVNIDCCVWSTVDGLLRQLDQSRIEVVKHACHWAGDGKFDWRTYLRHPNLKLA